MSISGPGLPRIVFWPRGQSNPGTSDLSPSLDETPNLVRPLLDPQLYYSCPSSMGSHLGRRNLRGPAQTILKPFPLSMTAQRLLLPSLGERLLVGL